MPEGKTRQFASYDVTFTLLALANTTQGINIRKGTHFRLYKLSGFSTGRYTLQIVDTVSRRELFQHPLRDDTIVGNAGLPFVLPMTYTFRENSTIEVRIVDVSGAGNTGQVVLIGEEYIANPGDADYEF